MAKAWKETVIIPTYEVGMPDKNPMFLENRVYQGSSGVVYPYPVIESVADTKEDKAYQAVMMENEYLKIMILPELGGRIQRAYDKVAQRDFIYYNSVVKPALVGLAGPWISGGIEFNWPQHHRPSTFLPVDYTIEESEDGSVTVWVSEMERMFHQKGMAGFTLRPGKAYLEIKGILYNRTAMPQTFLWWANPAVKVNDFYQSIFPQDVNAVFDHGKRDVSTFPIATGTYYKMDYSAGVDISNYRNIKVPTSYMAVNSKYDFVGGYENDTHGGMLHVANHHVSPGKKQWTWGNGDFGRAWDRNLTDSDGPYIEVMTGVFTENQPDFSWIMPYEEKEFVQYFMPYREIGVVKNANKELIFNIEPSGKGKAVVKLYATSQREVKVLIKTDSGASLLEESVMVSPDNLYIKEVSIGPYSIKELTLSILNKNNICILSWHAESDEIKRTPDADKSPLSPEETKTNEQLYLTGLRLEQYRHASWSPVSYYEEALRRDPRDFRCNNALGLWYLRKGLFSKAEPYLRAAVDELFSHTPNPYEGEPLYNLALCLKMLGRYDEAYDLFYKSTWNAAWQCAGWLSCAQISAMQGRFEDALYESGRSMIFGWHNQKARALKASALRHLGRKQAALALIAESLATDKFNYGCLFEKWLCTNSESDIEAFKSLARNCPANYEELAVDYMEAGLWTEAVEVLKLADDQGIATPMIWYYRAYSEKRLNISSEASLSQAPKAQWDGFFPNRLMAIIALKEAVNESESDYLAAYWLGCIYYDKRQHAEAMKWWRLSISRNDSFPAVWRCLALGLFNKEGKAEEALASMERAFALDTTDARVFMDLDQLRKKLGHPFKARLEALVAYPQLVAKRDDLLLEEITLLNQTRQFEAAKALLAEHKFHPWEGGEGKVSYQYQFCRVELAKMALAEKNYTKSAGLLEECLYFPENLGEGKLAGAQDNDFWYFLGLAYEGSGSHQKAVECWEKATEGPQEPAAALYYNDAKPDKIFYQGLALRALGREGEARGRFYRLVTFGERHIFDDVKMDYFAVSLPDLQIWDSNLNTINKVHCSYMLALGYTGLGRSNEASRKIDELKVLDSNHQGLQSLESLLRLGL